MPLSLVSVYEPPNSGSAGIIVVVVVAAEVFVSPRDQRQVDRLHRQRVGTRRVGDEVRQVVLRELVPNGSVTGSGSNVNPSVVPSGSVTSTRLPSSSGV